MRRAVFAWAAVIVTAVTSGMVASANVGVGTAGAAAYASKGAFCGANESLDKAGATVNSAAAFLAVLKSHQHQLAIMKKNAPSGPVGQRVRQLIGAAEAALAAKNASLLNNLPSGGPVDTYCGVDGLGNPLPSYFGKGKSTTFCSTFLSVVQATQNEPDEAGVLSALTAHQAQINQLASDLSSLPKSIKSKATTVVDKAQTAIATKNPSALGGQVNAVTLYCGQNQ